MKTIIIHAYYHQYDVYEIPCPAWERKLAECGGNMNAALRSFIEWGVDPIDEDSTEFHTEVEKINDGTHKECAFFEPIKGKELKCCVNCIHFSPYGCTHKD